MFRPILVTLALLIAGIAAANLSPKWLRLHPNTSQGRIVGGKTTKIENYPWQVLLWHRGQPYCGGSIITDKIILTAGHCVVSASVKRMQVRVGSSKSMSGGVLHQVAEFVLHEDYHVNESGVPRNDIALLVLEKAIELNKAAKPVSLFDQDEKVEVGTLATITGWGAIYEGSNVASQLQTVDIPLINKDKCDEAYTIFGGVPDGQICAAYSEGGKDACQGDSGGPLVIGDRQAGIVSWGYGCARKGYPGVYTEVAYYRDWIAEKAGI